MRIIQTTPSLAPEFGGTARCVPALGYELARLGNRVTILTLEMGFEDHAAVRPSHPNLDYVRLKAPLKIGMRPLWIPRYRETLLDLVSREQEVIIHDNGIWLPYSGIIHQVAEPDQIRLVTTIHGMLEPWAMNFGKVRKQIVWNLYQRRRLENNSVLHATSESESENLRALGLKTPIAVIPNGTEMPDPTGIADLAPRDDRIILFLSRIHPKKGLLNLVEAISSLHPEGWKVILAGYDEGGYWETIRKRVKSAGVGDFFEYIGPVSDQEKWSWYKLADLFILPSFSENFGLVVAEALACGTPVITTRGTPWRDLVDHHCGWWVDPEEAALRGALQEAISLGESELARMGENGRILVEKKYSWPAVAERMQQVYKWVLGGPTRTPDVIL